jgi:hypothetical protein
MILMNVCVVITVVMVWLSFAVKGFWALCDDTDDSRYTRFRYPSFHFSIMRSINILSAATVEAAAQAH